MEFFPAISPWVGVAAFFSALFVWLESSVSTRVKEPVSRWLQNLEPAEVTDSWSSIFAEAFDSVFGKRHLSWRCFRRSCVASIVSTVIVGLIFVELRFEWLKQTSNFVMATGFFVAFFTLALNLIPDYISLLESRYVIGWMRHSPPRKIFLLLVLDFVATFAIAFGAWGLLVGLVFGVSRWLEIFWREVVPLQEVGNWFYSTFFTSVWVWLYALSGFAVRLARSHGLNKTIESLKFLLPIEDKPFRTLGVISVLVVGFSYVVFSVLRGIVFLLT